MASYLMILALPLGGVTVLRLYESALVRQTESELVGQAAILAAAYRAALARARPAVTRAADNGVPAAPEWLPPEERWQPRAATLDLALDTVRPRPPAAPESAPPADPAAVAAGRELMAVTIPSITTARDRGGTGLGLAIVRALIVAHGGTIALVPSARGAAFQIGLPVR